MSPFEVNMTYEPFSREPEYIEANRAFVAMMDLKNATDLLDLACGTGLMTELAFLANPDLNLTAADLSAEQIELSQERFAELRARRGDGKPTVTTRCCSADEVPVADGSADVILMGNAIHMLPDRDKLLAEVARILRPGGAFAFNSSFYAGTFPEGTEKFYHDWIKNASIHVMERDRELRAQGRPGIPRKRGTVRRAFSNPWLSPDEWARSLETHGLKVARSNERTVIMTQRSFETIGAYGGFAEVLLSGYPVRDASLALQTAVAPTLEAFGRKDIPRYWLEVIAVKTN